LTLVSDQINSFGVLGVQVHLARMDQVLDEVDRWIEERKGCRYIVATGMHGVMEARRSPYFKEVVDAAGLFVPDGFSLVLIARFRRFKIKNRVSGPDLLWEACKRAEGKGHRMFFYGDSEDTLKQLTAKLGDSLPNLKIAGAHSPPFRQLTPEEDEQEVRMINDSGADIIWVGLGLPKQEQWIYEHRDRLNVPVAVGVGAAFKFLSGRVKRAPRWIGENGFEWLWRFVQEPRRVWRRVIIDGPHFMLYAVLEGLDPRRPNNPK
jgi:N-acetylglucosaminyldiphosphoundecaprenol N-acetyl-beta-D-mannosaminyltransferase